MRASVLVIAALALGAACSYGSAVTPTCKLVVFSAAGGAGGAGGSASAAGGAAGGAAGTTAASTVGATVATSAGTGPASNCDPPPKCDRGDGTIVASEECCKLRGNDEYGLVCMTVAPKDFTSLCAANAGVAACCNNAKKAYDACLKGNP